MQTGTDPEDIGIVALHEDGHWSLSTLTHTRDLSLIIDQLKAQPANGGSIALISIDEDFFVIMRLLGSQLQMMISDVTYALESDFAADVLDALDLPFPEEDDTAQPGGDIDLLQDLGIPARELETLSDDLELFPDEQIEAIAARLGFVERYLELTGE